RDATVTGVQTCALPISVTADQIVVTKDGHMPEGRKKLKTDSEAGVHVYELRKFMRSNAGTCVNQKPIVKKGQHVKRGQIIADGRSEERRVGKENRSGQQ